MFHGHLDYSQRPPHVEISSKTSTKTISAEIDDINLNMLLTKMDETGFIFNEVLARSLTKKGCTLMK